MSRNKTVFVTVGTTKFSKLIDTMSQDSTIELVHELGYDCIQLQTGREYRASKNYSKVQLTYKPYFEDFTSEIDKCNLVVSHAGAGTCLEVLKRNKPLIIVVNEDLMDNHQIELAQRLENMGYVYYCNVHTLREVLRKDVRKLKPYPVPNKQLFSTYLDVCTGFNEINKTLVS